MTFAGLLDTTRTIYAAEWKAFLGIGLLTLGPLMVYEVLVYTLVPGSTLSAVWLSEVVIGLPAYLVGLIALGGWVALARSLYAGKAAGAGAGLREALSRIAALLGAGLLLLVGWTVGFIIVVVPGIWFYVTYVLVYPALFSGQGLGASLKTAANVTRGAFWRVAGVLLVVGIVLWASRFVLGLAAHFIFGLSIPVIMAQSATSTTAGVAAALVAFVAGVIAGPAFGIALEVLYRDLNVEGKVSSAA